MIDAAQVLREVDTLEAIQRALAAIADRIDDVRRKDLIDLRRQLANQIAQTGNVANPYFTAAGPDIYRTYRIRFSAMRSAAALHQANWPAVRLGEDPANYAASAVTVREANRDFIAWVRQAVARPRSEGPSSTRA